MAGRDGGNELAVERQVALGLLGALKAAHRDLCQISRALHVAVDDLDEVPEVWQVERWILELVTELEEGIDEAHRAMP